MRGRLTIIRSDVFLHCTLGGFARPDGSYCHPRFHSLRLRRAMDRLIRRYRRVPYGEVMNLAERFGRPVGSLRATMTHRRNYLRGLSPQWRRVRMG